MSDTEDRVLWHRTPSGWVSGGSVLTADLRDQAVAPPDRLETWEARYEVCSQYGVPVGVVADRVWPPARDGRPPSAAEWEAEPPPWRSFGGWVVERPTPA